MPIRKAIKDSFGLKDVMMDTLDTLQGSRFSYRSFEPSEGVPHMGSSRTSRIMAGLRYSNITTKKRWLEPAPTSKFLQNTGRGMNDEILVDEDSEPLEFEDPQSSDPMEELYKASRKMVFGDYNYPVIDFRIPLWQQARLERRQQRQRGYGGISNTNHPALQKLENKSKYDTLGPRDGCIDVVVQRGKGHYVLVDDLSDEESQIMSPPTKTPPPPVRKPTLSEVHKNNNLSASNSTPTTNKKHVNQSIVQPSFSTPSNQRYPSPLSTTASTNTFTPATENLSKNTTQNDEITTQWQWPEETPKKPSLSFDDEDLLSGNVWK